MYCAWCGEPLTQVRLEQTVIPFYPDQAGEELEGVLVLHNSGSRRVRAQLSVPDAFTVDHDSVELEPNAGPAVVPFSFRAPQTGSWTESISVFIEGGEPVRATVVCAPRPVFRLETEFLNAIEGDKGPFSLSLRHVEGGPAYVTAVRSVTGLMEVADCAGAVQPGGELTVQLRPSGSAPLRSGTHDEVLEIELMNAGRTQHMVQVRVQEPPRLGLSATDIDFGSVMPDRRRQRTLRLTNYGQGPLEIRQVAFKENDGNWQLVLPQRLPFLIPGGNADNITVILEGAQPGSKRASLFIATNDGERSELEVAVRANVLAEPPEAKGYVGIDFGTTHSCICVGGDEESARALVLDEAALSQEDRVTMPSCVYWPQAPQPGNLRDCVVGRQALEMSRNPRTAQATSVSVKRRLGQRHPERILGVPLMPQEIAARIIRYLVDRAEDHLAAVVRKAVVTVPANFTPPQVKATIEACRLAGLDAAVVQKEMMDEPVGAAVDYLSEADRDDLGETFRVLVYDFGGGTLDVSVIEHGTDPKAGKTAIRVLASKGDNALGGDDLTEALRQLLRQKAEAMTGGTVPADPRDRWEAVANAELRQVHVDNYSYLHDLAERMKRDLSDADKVSAACDLWVVTGQQKRKEYVRFEVRRWEYEDAIRERLESTRKLIERALETARMGPEAIDLILLVGMTSRTPLVKHMLWDWFRQEPVLHDDPKACVARGAYKKGEMMSFASEDAPLLLRELGKTNCRYGIIIVQRLRKRFVPMIGEGEEFPVTGRYPQNGLMLNAAPGARLLVVLNRGDSDSVDGNEEISHLGEIVVEGYGTEPLPLEVVMQVQNHRSVHVSVLVAGAETRAARFEEF